MYPDGARDYWQYIWDRDDIYSLPEQVENPTYVLGMFPYTSGTLHMGHVRNYSITDAYARYRRLKGDTVLHPMGWDAFGLPAENAAYKRYTDPESWTRSCISRMRQELESLGFGYDWSREITTCDPEYYRWNQWFFARFFEAGLVDYTGALVNWCPDCETSLADAQVIEHEGNRVCWRCETPVTHRELDQWFFKITEYAEELDNALDELSGWPRNVCEIQRNWIGRSEGVVVPFSTTTSQDVAVFTTRLDTIYGATFVAISPDHEIAVKLADDDDSVAEFIDSASVPSKNSVSSGGIETDLMAIHPVTDEELPVYIAEYVLDDVGTGAVMGVPGHNRRDHEFANAHDLPVTTVVSPESIESDDPKAPYLEDGVLIESGPYDGLSSKTARDRIFEELETAERTVTYRLRDWLISRQRYWGTPIPIVHCDDCGPVLVPDEDLPVELPEYVQTTGNPLESIESFLETDCPDCGKPARRETDTMDTFVDSSWYFLRFLSPDRTDAPFDSDLANSWLPIDVYVGGEEHAILHLLYIRFFTRALADLGLLDVREPVDRLLNHGMVLYEGEKMSSDRGNIVAPHEYGPETTRLFLLSAAHPERDFEWTAKNVGTAFDFQQRLYEMVSAFVDSEFPVRSDRDVQDEYLEWLIDGTIASVSSDFERFGFHNAITSIRDLTKTMRRYRTYEPPNEGVYRDGLSALTRMMAPITPYLGEELWNLLRGEGLVANADWPAHKADLESFRLERQLIRETLHDVRDIIDVVEIEDPTSIDLIVAEDWKYRAYERARNADRDAAIVGVILEDQEISAERETTLEYAEELQATQSQLQPIIDQGREFELLRSAAWLFHDEFGANVTVELSNGHDQLSRRAKPNKPAIHIE